MRMLLPNVKMPRAVEKEVRAHVMRRTGLQLVYPAHELDKARLAEAVEARGVHVVVVRAHLRAGSA